MVWPDVQSHARNAISRWKKKQDTKKENKRLHLLRVSGMIPDSERRKRRKTAGGCSERRDVPPSQVHSNFTSLLLKVEPFKMAFTQSTAKPRERRERKTIDGTNKQKHHYILCKFTPASREKPNKPD